MRHQQHTLRERLHLVERRIHDIEMAQHNGAVRADAHGDAIGEVREMIRTILNDMEEMAKP